MHWVTRIFIVAGHLTVAPLAAQAVPDSLQADSLRIARLAPLEVRVTRAPESRLRVPAPITVIDSSALRGAQLENGIDEAVGRVPGIYAANRFNPSLDQRLVIRGAGARANFGVRGLKILLDGIPQTLPDGQSQLTNVDFGFVDRAEVLIGSSSALYGNAAGGVIAFNSSTPTTPLSARLRVTAGRFGTTRLSGQVSGSRGFWSGTVAGTRFASDGSRQHSSTLSRQLSVGVNRVVGNTWLVKARYFFASSPEAQNPGALTLAEFERNPDSAAAANILRGADKSVRQHQIGLTAIHTTTTGRSFEATLYGITRGLDNPLATAPPGPPSATVGTFSAIDRKVGGARIATIWPLWSGTRLSVGADVQTMRDDRVNRRSRGGVTTDTLTAEQRETATEIGPYVSFHWEPTARILMTATGRYDRVSFRVADRFRAGGVDRSGTKAMSAASGSVGASLTLGRNAAVFGSIASAFESPTTTELVNQANGTIGFNTDLGPQRATTIEVGLKTTGKVTASLGLYRTAVKDALVQAREQDGRAFFENAAQLGIRGVEAGVQWRPASWLSVLASYTHTDATFAKYLSRNGAATDTLTGKQVPGIPRHSFRGVATITVARFGFEWDQQIVSQFFADDRNTVAIPGWGAGVASIRGWYQARIGHSAVRPFVSVNNAWGRRYVAAATVNGFGGRVFEPAPGRWAFVGIELGVR